MDGSRQRFAMQNRRQSSASLVWSERRPMNSSNMDCVRFDRQLPVEVAALAAAHRHVPAARCRTRAACAVHGMHAVYGVNIPRCVGYRSGYVEMGWSELFSLSNLGFGRVARSTTVLRHAS
jgi:hypothetical protein